MKEASRNAPVGVPRVRRFKSEIPTGGRGARRSSGWAVTLAMALGAAAFFAVDLDSAGFFDNEGRFAEMAREMLASGDFVTPRLNYDVHLTKPPLTPWLTALVFAFTGPSEWGRLVSVAAAAITLFATGRLGARLYGERVGRVAVLLLATTPGFVLEARTLRPDGLLVAAMTSAFLLWVCAEATTGPARGRRLAAMYAVLGLGVLSKGMVPLVLFAVPVVAATAAMRGWRGVAGLRPGLGITIIAAVAAPWHLIAAWRNPGFLWDYVVNQHVLVAFDQKLPRDGSRDSLLAFWGAFLGRAAPSVLSAPLAWIAAREHELRGEPVPATVFVTTWLASVPLLFSLTPARLEQYCLPALPAVTLLAASGMERLQSTAGPRLGRRVQAGAIGVGVLGAVLATRGNAILGLAYWLAATPAVARLAVPVGLALAFGGAGAAWAVRRRSATALVASVAAVGAVTSAAAVRALTELEPLFSWRTVAAQIAQRAPVGTEVVFEAPTEYQLVGALTFYTGRRVTLLQPPGWEVPPTYLAERAPGMFLSPAGLRERWRTGAPMVLVTDPTRRRDTSPDVVSPAYVLARFGDRWVVSNRPPAGRPPGVPYCASRATAR